MSEVKDTLQHAVGAILGKDTKDLPSCSGSDYIEWWKRWLVSEGYELKTVSAKDAVKGEHIVLFSDVDGATQAAVYDGDELKSYPNTLAPGQAIRPIQKLVLTKKAGDKKDA
jgi:hypothetical protein